MSDENPDGEGEGTFTIPPDAGGRWIRREKRLNLFGMLVVAGVVVLAGSGMAGVHSTTSTVDSGTFIMEVLHASITRPGLATPFAVTVRSQGGALAEFLTLRISSDYLAIFDEHGLTPAPTSAHSDSRWTWWTFQPPEGSHELTVALDARLEPSVQWRRDADVALILGDEPEAETQITTWVLP